jgi:hypothetical protein
MKPSHVAVDGVTYEIDEGERAFRVIYEPQVVRQGEIPGTSRPSQNARPDELGYVWDDWSAGEGHKFLVDEPGHPSKRGYFSASGPVDVRKKGQLSLGYTVQTSKASTTTTLGPYLAVAGGNIFVAGADLTRGMQYLNAGVWTDIGGAVDCNGSRGGISPHHSGVFTANGADVHRVTTAAAVSWNTDNGIAPLAADNRIYYGIPGTTTSTLRRVGLDAAAAGATMTTFNGVGSTYSGAPIASAAVGSRIYTLLANTGEDPRLWVLENDVGREVAVFTGLRVNVGDPGEQQMCVVNGIVFVCGWELSQAGLEVARLDYYDGQVWGTAGSLAHRNTTSTSNTRFTCVVPGAKNELVLGQVEDASQLSARLMAYDLTTGGLSCFQWGAGGASAVKVCSAALLDGKYYMAMSGGSTAIERTPPVGSGPYFNSVSVIGPVHDFGYPLTAKTMSEVEIHCETLPTGATARVEFIMDGTTTVNQDATGSDMTISSGTRAKFTVSDHDTERTFRYFQPKVQLNQGGSSENTPIVYSIAYKCRAAEKAKFYEVRVNGRRNETPGAAISGALAMQTLKTLTESTSNRIASFVPWFLGAPAPSPRGTQGSGTTESVQIDAASFDLDKQGEGTATLRLKVL